MKKGRVLALRLDMKQLITRSLVGLLLMGATSAVWSQESESAPPPAPVKVGKASKQSISTMMTATGTVVSRNDARIAAETPGRLTWVAEPGTHVERGKVLARVDDAALKLRLRDNDATIARLEAREKYLQSQVERFERLLTQKIASQSQLDEAISQRDMTAQEINQARVARDQTLHDLERARVVEPFSGQVVERLHQPGEFVNTGGELVRLVDTQHVEVRARDVAAERDARAVRPQLACTAAARVAGSRAHPQHGHLPPRAVPPAPHDRPRDDPAAGRTARRRQPFVAEAVRMPPVQAPEDGAKPRLL